MTNSDKEGKQLDIITSMFDFIHSWMEDNEGELRISTIDQMNDHLLLVQVFYLKIEDDSDAYFELLLDHSAKFEAEPMTFEQAYKELDCCFKNHIFN